MSLLRRLITVVALAGVLLLPADGQATLIADPDLLDESAYPVGSVINEAFDGFTLSSYGSPEPSYSFPGNVLRYARGGDIETHTLGYDYLRPSYSTDDRWGGIYWGRLVLRVDLDLPASTVFADIMAFGASTDIMQLTAYDASSEQLGITYHQDFPYGMPPTRVEYSHPEPTIAYFTVTDYAPYWFSFVIDKVGATTVPDADFDDDDDVDGADFLVWQRGEVSNPPSAEDLADWKDLFGTPSALSSSTSVPEPGSIVLLLVAFLCSLRRRRLT